MRERKPGSVAVAVVSEGEVVHSMVAGYGVLGFVVTQYGMVYSIVDWYWHGWVWYGGFHTV